MTEIGSRPILSINIGFWGLLTLVFITLKLTKVINWDWIFVLSPLWIPLMVGMIVLGFVLFIMAVGYVVAGNRIFK